MSNFISYTKFRFVILFLIFDLVLIFESKSQNIYKPYFKNDSVFYRTLNDDPFKNNISASAGLFGYMTSAASGGFGIEISPTIIIKKIATLSGYYRSIFPLGEKFKNDFYKNKGFNILELTCNIHLYDKVFAREGGLNLSEEYGYRKVVNVPLNRRIIHSVRLGITSLRIPLDFSSYDRGEFEGAYRNVYGMIDYYVGFIGYGFMMNNHAEYYVERYGTRLNSMQGIVFFDLIYSPESIENKITYSRKPFSEILNYHQFGCRLGVKSNLPRMKYGANFEIGYFPGVGSYEPLNDVYINLSFFYILNGTLKFLKPRS
jgi:hypothetical protein